MKKEKTEFAIGHLSQFAYYRKEWIEENDKSFAKYLTKTNTWIEYLTELDEIANEQLDTLMNQMVKNEGVTEQLKREDPLEWVRCMNSIKNRAEEIVLYNLIYI